MNLTDYIIHLKSVSVIRIMITILAIQFFNHKFIPQPFINNLKLIFQ